MAKFLNEDEDWREGLPIIEAVSLFGATVLCVLAMVGYVVLSL